MTTDILLVSVSKNPIEVLNSILPLDIPHVIVPKIKVSQKDERQLFDTIIKNGYDYVFQFVDIKEDVLTLILENILQKKHNDKLI